MNQRTLFFTGDDNPFILNDFPISPAGAAVFLENLSENDVEVYVEESDDGSSFTPVTCYSSSGAGGSGASGDPVVTLKGKGKKTILFATQSKYVKIFALGEGADFSAQSLRCELVQPTPHTASRITG